MPSYKIHTDGGSRGNPGPAALGFIIDLENERVASVCKYLGIATNNVAEYEAIVEALRTLNADSYQPGRVECFLDSLLVVNQIKGIFKLKQVHLAPYLNSVVGLVKELQRKGFTISFAHIPREQNSEADRLVNKALDKAMN